MVVLWFNITTLGAITLPGTPEQRKISNCTSTNQVKI